MPCFSACYNISNEHLLCFYSKTQPSSAECSKPFRLLRVNGLAVKSNTVVPLKNGCHVTSAGLQPLQLFSPAQMEQRDLNVGTLYVQRGWKNRQVDIKTSQSFFISTAVTRVVKFCILEHQLKSEHWLFYL